MLKLKDLTIKFMSRIDSPHKPEGFDDKVENLKFMKENVPHNYMGAIYEIRDMSQGGDPEGSRNIYYPGWEDEDFEALLIELGEDLN